MPEQELLTSAKQHALEDTDGTLTRLAKTADLISGRLEGVQTVDCEALLRRHHILEPMREGQKKLTGVLDGLREHLAVVEGRMVALAESIELADDKGADSTAIRDDMFQEQIAAASLLMEIVEQEDHLRVVEERLGEQASVHDVKRAEAMVAMREKLSSQLVDIERLKAWFKREQDAAVKKYCDNCRHKDRSVTAEPCKSCHEAATGETRWEPEEVVQETA